jgi:putative iron-only hydrogenase system regulator
MEKRLGIVAILVNTRTGISEVNSIISEYNELVLGRFGLPLKEKGINIISLVVEADTDQLGALTGKLGRLDGIKVKSVLTQYKDLNEKELVKN